MILKMDFSMNSMMMLTFLEMISLVMIFQEIITVIEDVDADAAVDAVADVVTDAVIEVTIENLIEDLGMLS